LEKQTGKGASYYGAGKEKELTLLGKKRAGFSVKRAFLVYYNGLVKKYVYGIMNVLDIKPRYENQNQYYVCTACMYVCTRTITTKSKF